jgi:prephenate dehydrogenase
MLFEQVTVVGVGLIGGSVGLAVRARKLAARVIGVDRDPVILSRAVELGAIDTFTTDLVAGVTAADLVVVCTPVDRIAEVILAAAPHVRPGAIFTDTGSTKENIVTTVAGALPKGVSFVPAHPLAGREKNGVEHARANLFENRLTITIQSYDEMDPSSVERVEKFWRGLGSPVVRMYPCDHDRILAGTSHLPHVVASALAAMTPVEWLEYTAGGFRDTTRIASGDPAIWAAIFLDNKDSILAAVGHFADRIELLRRMLAAGDAAGLLRWLSEGKQVRDALGS